MAAIPSTMKAAQFTSASGGVEKNLTINHNAPMPKKYDALPKDSALVKVAYTTLNQFDYKMPEMPVIGRLAVSKPAIPCEDFSGTVVASTLAHLKPGQRVFGISSPPKFGALAEYVLVTGADLVVPVPDSLSLMDTSAIGVAAGTAYQSIAPFVKSGNKIFINGGSGGVGTAAIQIAKARGCYVVTSCSAANVELCKSLGADEVIDYRSEDIVKGLERRGQFDLLVDFVGSPAIYYAAHKYLVPKGLFVTTIGPTQLREVKGMMAMFMLPKWLGGDQRTAKFVVLAPKKADYEQLAQWMVEGKLKTVVQETIEMEGAAEGFAKLRSGRTKGKVIVKVAGG